MTPARAARTKRRQQLRAAVAVLVGALAVAGAVGLGAPVRRTAPPEVGIPAILGGGQAAASAEATSAAADPGAMKELCLAYLADRDAALDAGTLRALAAAAGGAGNIATWCQAITARPAGSRGKGRGGPPSARGNGRGRDRPKGPPSDRGRGHREPLTTGH